MHSLVNWNYVYVTAQIQSQSVDDAVFKYRVIYLRELEAQIRCDIYIMPYPAR